MPWADDYYAGTYMVKTSNVGKNDVWFDKLALEIIKESVRMLPLAQSRPLPGGSGTIIEFFQYLQMAKSVSAATLSEGVLPDATQYTVRTLRATLGEFGGWVQMSHLMKQTFIDRCKSVGRLVANNAAEILDTVAHQAVAAGGYPLRTDYATDTEAVFEGTIDDADSTHFQDAALQGNTNYGDADYDLNQSVVIITSGAAYGQARAVIDYDAAGGSLGNGMAEVSPAWDKTPVAGDTYRVVTLDGIAAGDKITYEVLKRARTVLKWNHAQLEDGYCVAVVDPDVISDIMDDTRWKDVHTYKDSAQGIFRGEIGKFMGVRFIEETNPFKCNSTTRGTAGASYGVGAGGANYNADGTVTVVPIMGQNAWGVTKLTPEEGMSRDEVMVWMRDWKELGQPIPRFGSAGWMVPFVAKQLNAMHICNVICKAA